MCCRRQYSRYLRSCPSDVEKLCESTSFARFIFRCTNRSTINNLMIKNSATLMNQFKRFVIDSHFGKDINSFLFLIDLRRFELCFDGWDSPSIWSFQDHPVGSESSMGCRWRCTGCGWIRHIQTPSSARGNRRRRPSGKLVSNLFVSATRITVY